MVNLNLYLKSVEQFLISLRIAEQTRRRDSFHNLYGLRIPRPDRQTGVHLLYSYTHISLISRPYCDREPNLSNLGVFEWIGWLPIAILKACAIYNIYYRTFWNIGTIIMLHTPHIWNQITKKTEHFRHRSPESYQSQIYN